MNYSDQLLKQIRDLNDELDQYVDPATPDQVARRDELLQALAWHVHKLQMRVLSGPSTATISPAKVAWPRGAVWRSPSASHAGA